MIKGTLYGAWEEIDKFGTSGEKLLDRLEITEQGTQLGWGPGALRAQEEQSNVTMGQQVFAVFVWKYAPLKNYIN